MPVLTIASSKGGPGKTTVAMLLAGALAAEGGAVLILDADPTQALSRWAVNAYEGPPIETVAEVDETQLAHIINERAEAAPVVIVDTAGFGNRAATVAMTSADAIIVPSLAGEADVTEAEKTIRLAGGLARAARRDIPARVLLNRVKRTQLASRCTGVGFGRTAAHQGDLERPGCVWGAVLLRPRPHKRRGRSGAFRAYRRTARPWLVAVTATRCNIEYT